MAAWLLLETVPHWWSPFHSWRHGFPHPGKVAITPYKSTKYPGKAAISSNQSTKYQVPSTKVPSTLAEQPSPQTKIPSTKVPKYQAPCITHFWYATVKHWLTNFQILHLGAGDTLELRSSGPGGRFPTWHMHCAPFNVVLCNFMYVTQPFGTFTIAHAQCTLLASTVVCFKQTYKTRPLIPVPLP